MKNYIDITNSLDYIVLNERLFPYLNKDEIPVGIRNFMLLGKPCLLNIVYEGNKYKRMFSEALPHQLVSDICSVQIYKLITE